MDKLRVLSFIGNLNGSKERVIVNKILCESNKLVDLILVIRISRRCNMTICQGYNLIVTAFSTDMGEIGERMTILDQSTTRKARTFDTSTNFDATCGLFRLKTSSAVGRYASRNLRIIEVSLKLKQLSQAS
jgi:hypothetical protein